MPGRNCFENFLQSALYLRLFHSFISQLCSGLLHLPRGKPIVFTYRETWANQCSFRAARAHRFHTECFPRCAFCSAATGLLPLDTFRVCSILELLFLRPNPELQLQARRLSPGTVLHACQPSFLLCIKQHFSLISKHSSNLGPPAFLPASGPRGEPETGATAAAHCLHYLGL